MINTNSFQNNALNLYQKLMKLIMSIKLSFVLHYGLRNVLTILYNNDIVALVTTVEPVVFVTFKHFFKSRPGDFRTKISYIASDLKYFTVCGGNKDCF